MHLSLILGSFVGCTTTFHVQPNSVQGKIKNSRVWRRIRTKSRQLTMIPQCLRTAVMGG